MFMTPKEITQHYQPLDADREEIYEDQSAMGGTYREENDAEVWERKSTEAQMNPEEYHYTRMGQTPEKSGLDFDSLAGHSSYPRYPNTNETTSAVGEWEYREASYLQRKHEEKSNANYEKWNGPSIWDSVRQSGVQEPVHLGQQFGSQGKPEVVGGHHRIASAMDTRPNELIPVIHHEDINQAKSSSGAAAKAGFKYT